MPFYTSLQIKTATINMAILTKMQQLDFKKFFLEKGDPGFSPERNKAVIEKTIRQTDELYRLKQKQFSEDYAERADAIVTYLKAIDRGGVSTNLKQFFGKEFYMLNGDKKREEARAKIREGIELARKKAKLRQKIFS